MAIDIAEARELAHGSIVYRVQIVLKGSAGTTTLYFSDQLLSETSAQVYEAYLTDLSAFAEAVSFSSSIGENTDAQLNFINDPIDINGVHYDHLILSTDNWQWHGAMITVYEQYQVNGQNSAFNKIFVGALDEPTNITPYSFSCSVSSYPNWVNQKFRQQTVTIAGFPNAAKDAIGKVFPTLIGTGSKFPTLKTAWGAQTTLASACTDTATTLALTDTADFPASGQVRIADEYINYTGKTATTITGCTRVVGSRVVHDSGETVYEVLASYTCMYAGHTTGTLNNVYAEYEGKLVRLTSGWSKDTTGGYSSVLFANKPLLAVPMNDGLTITTAQPPETRQLTRRANNIGFIWHSSTGAGSTAFPADPALSYDPAGTTRWSKVSFDWTATPLTATASGYLYVGGVLICRVANGVVNAMAGGRGELGFSSWQPSLAYNATGVSNCGFTVANIEQTAEVQTAAGATNEGDPAGGTNSRAASGVPLGLATGTGGGTNTGTFSFGTNPVTTYGGTLSNIYLEIDFNMSSANGGLGTTPSGTGTLTCSGSVIGYCGALQQPNMRGNGKVRIPLSNWPGVQNVSLSAGTFTNANFYATIVGAQVTYTHTLETSIVRPSKSGTIKIKSPLDLGNVYVDAQGALEGVTYISRPDRALYYWLVTVMGFDSTMIDTTSFNAAGALYASNSYVICGDVTDKVDGLATAYDIAYNFRSILSYVAGVFYLYFIPDTYPTGLTAINRNNMASEPTFNFSPRVNCFNYSAVRFKKGWIPDINGYERNVLASDIPTGWDTIERELIFDWVYTDAVARSVAANILKRNNKPQLMIEFDAFQDNFAFTAGSSFILSGSTMWNNKRFFIESTERIDRYRIKVRGVGWW